MLMLMLSVDLYLGQVLQGQVSRIWGGQPLPNYIISNKRAQLLNTRIAGAARTQAPLSQIMM